MVSPVGLPLTDPRIQVLLDRIRRTDNGTQRRIIWFGSSVRGKSDGDVDIMVLVEPISESWGPRENIQERQRVESLAYVPGVLLDLWIRTTDQYEEARSVIGGLEYAADRYGVTLFSRALSRPPRIRRSIHDIRDRNVSDWMELARRLLGRAVMLAKLPAEDPERTRSKTPEHYAGRAAISAIGALMVWHNHEPPSKYETVQVWQERLREIDPRAAKQLDRVLSHESIGVIAAHSVLKAAVTQLLGDSRLSRMVEAMAMFLGQPTFDLAPVPPLKILGQAPRHAPIT
jgi:predicted nucleotidyltransferase